MPSDVKFGEQGFFARRTEPDFDRVLQSAVDYRGDISLCLVGGEKVEAFLFNYRAGSLELFENGSSAVRKIPSKDVESIEFSGKDEAKGKSWEDWQNKKLEKKTS
ncbi:MAG: hypothetical protein EA369_05135 [Bradymonadales bacterium]|nr:MAG: hypothetical protein EA369_05135 [Bradymonadales bacterium]